jgi:hypothetical protein
VRALLLFLSAMALQVSAQQVPDEDFTPQLLQARYPLGQGPRVGLDAGHHNFHTLDGRYQVFGRILSAEGYRVSDHTGRFTAENLQGTDVLVIANALSAANLEDWSLPDPSAFDSLEIEALRHWVLGGGRLFLIADHMPFAGAATALGRAFGFGFLNCYALDARKRKIERFYRSEGLDPTHPIVQGMAPGQRVDTVVTFTGSAFLIPVNADPLVMLSEQHTLWEPTVDGEFNENTPRRSGQGWHQGASLDYGRGRVVVFGEAAMFSGQLVGPHRRPMGLNQPEARDNITLLRNILAWLTEARP